ncbi:MAG TPA: hypothetical protein P5132_02455 [Bacteroidales bacterium]|nr:hypothetical protein [Bacteroidales bacterium]
MKKRILFGLFLTFSISIALTAFSIKQSVISPEPGVNCDCQWFGGGCRADGWGATCHTGSENCWTADKNCGRN